MKSPIDIANELVDNYATRDLNEADTRHQVIDVILHQILSWPRSSVLTEDYIKPGYADYVLVNNSKKHLIIEAKREGAYFKIPNSFNTKATFRYIRIDQLLTDEPIQAAITQVHTYCITEGISYACITNGHEWIFFKSFESNRPWSKLNAFVISSLDYFSKQYTHAVNNLSFSNIFEASSLKSLLSISPKHRELYYPKSKITNYNHPIASNTHASYLTPIFDKYFGDIDIADVDFMKHCYVKDRYDTEVNKNLHGLIHDSLTPFFLQYKIRQLTEDDNGGQISKILLETSKTRKEKLITLYGGKGAGKSTFLKRLLLFDPPMHLKHFAKLAIVDLLKTPEDKTSISNKVWNDIVCQLDTDNILSSDRPSLLQLFDLEYEIAAKQDLYGLDPGTQDFNRSLNKLVMSWKKNRELCAKALCRYYNNQLKGIIISIDNTDQYAPELQDYCFSLAKQISSDLHSIVIISMREERFYSSNIHGTLDAFKLTGFHISSPKPQNVFKKRIDYILGLIANDKLKSVLLYEVDEKSIAEITYFLKLLQSEFHKRTSSLDKFLTSCTHGNIRLALQLFREFILSGYTNIYEMVSKRFTTIQIHQVLKPVMIPSRYYYDESKSYIPNIFQIRSKEHGSHFTGLRILHFLNDKYEKGSEPYTEISELSSYFSDQFIMLDDFKLNIDIMLKHGLIESKNRLDKFSDNVDSVMLTAFGEYFLKELNRHFTYLDLICVDCGLFNEELANTIIASSNDEITLFLRRNKNGRLLKRINKVRQFIEYLALFEKTEREEYSLTPDSSSFADKLITAFKRETPLILRSAKIRITNNIKDTITFK